MDNQITLRHERPGDYYQVEALTREAFWGRDQPACNEHLLVSKLRKSPGFVPQLDYVAEIGGALAGNIMYSLAKIVADDGGETPVLCFGPLSVLPRYQGTGVGGALVRHTVAQARDMGHRAIVIFGHPDYYPRFGFGRAADFGLRTGSGGSFDAFMALPLYPGALEGVSGRFYEDPVFHDLGKDELEEYDKAFPPKERRALEGLEVLLRRLGPGARAAIEGLGLAGLWQVAGKSQREIARLPGVDEGAIEAIRQVLAHHGYIWGESKK